MSKLRVRLRHAVLSGIVGLAVVGMVGCKQFVMLGYLIGGPPSIEPAFDAETGESMTDYGVTVAVVAFAPNEVRFDFSKIDYQLAKQVTFQLVGNHVQCVDPESIRAWLDRHDDWDTPQEIGQAMNVDYVVYIDLLKFNLYEENSANLYRGRAEAIVSVIKMDQDRQDGEEIFQQEVVSRWPTRIPKSTSEITYSAFRGQYLQRLSDEIGRLFYEHYAGDDIGHAT